MTPKPRHTPIPLSRATVPYTLPQQATLPLAQPKTPSPEEAYAEEERVRVLEARRAPIRIALDSDNNALPQQRLHDEGELAHEAQGHGEALSHVASPEDGEHERFLDQHHGSLGYVQPTSAYELTRGTIITARWITAIDSTLPGGVIKAMVTQNVYDSRTHSVPVLVPGTILTGEGDSRSQAGEARYLCIFDRIELPPPDSRKFYMGSNNADGPQGENGANVSTDTHSGRQFGRAFLYTLLQAGATAASRATTVVDVGGNIGQAVPPNTQLAPTFHQYPGAPLTIIVNHDLPLDRFKENP